MKPHLLDIAYGRVRAPDLDRAEAFLRDFGMRRAARTERALYMRGHGTDHHLHVVEQGEAGAVSLAFHVAGLDDLQRLACTPGASAIETVDEPGGGTRLRLSEPNGLTIELLHGMAHAAALPLPQRRANTAAEPLRRAPGNTVLARGPAHVHRIGHGVIFTPDVAATTDWFVRTLGMLISDVVTSDDRSQVFGNFLRVDHGSEPVDHHTLLVAHADEAGLHHLSFEVADLDDVMIGHDHLRTSGYTHLWGVSRHVQGGQISDYWVDPFGVMFEHWTDGDRLNADEPLRHLNRAESVGPWGPPATPAFRAHRVTPIRPWIR